MAMCRPNLRAFHSLALIAAAALLLLASGRPAGAEAAPLRYEIYMVQAGDTVENIAARFGVDALLIRTFNNLEKGQSLTPGQSLAVVLPGLPKPDAAQPSLEADAAKPKDIPPRYAFVARGCRITAECSGDQVLFEPPAGSRVIVAKEQGNWWGVLMADGSVGWAPKSALRVTDETVSAETIEKMLQQAGRVEVVEYAKRFLGLPYKYGGRLPYNTDCSLFVQTVYRAFGVRLPRTARAQAEVGQAVPLDQMLPGDRLYFADRKGRVNHAGIYVGNLQFIHASSAAGCVTISSLGSRKYWSRLYCVRR